MIQSIQNEARNIALRAFKEKNIKMASVRDLAKRKEDGTIEFRDPDTGQVLESRERAQGWVNSYNNDVRAELDNLVRQKERELISQAQPALRLMEFAPTYDAMDDLTKSVFDELIEPYGVTNVNGDVIGFNVNLNSMAQQAKAIVSRFSNANNVAQPAQPAAPAEGGEPAMDIKSGSSQSSTNDEPKTLEEAMMAINMKKKGN